MLETVLTELETEDVWTLEGALEVEVTAELEKVLETADVWELDEVLLVLLWCLLE